MHDTPIEVGTTATTEPMLTLGRPGWELGDDGRTVVTRDRLPCGQLEHTLRVTPTGAEVLTPSPDQA